MRLLILGFIIFFIQFNLNTGYAKKNRSNKGAGIREVKSTTVEVNKDPNIFVSNKDQKDWISQVQRELNQKIKDSGVSSQLGVYVVVDSLDKMIEITTHNSDKMMLPASITKLATAAATIAFFPPGYKFKTQLLSSAKIESGILRGDLILKGGGDPSFVSENMWFLVNTFLRTGVRAIDGDIIVDDSLFDNKRYDSSREDARVDRAYDAPVGAMSFNWNSINVFVRPASEVGKPAQVYVDPENEYIKLIGEVKTSRAGNSNLSVERKEDKFHFGDVIEVGGSIPVGSKELVVYKNITKPDIWSAYNLKSFLSQRGILFKGKIKTGKTPKDASILAEAESKGVEQILADMNKWSNNYVAEMLTKNVGSIRETPASLSLGMNMINEYLKKIGLKADEFSLINPSGLTRENKITPKAMGKILETVKNNFQVQSEFMTSLPVAGIDGTLRSRMKDTEAQQWVRAKTGLLTGVASLAGYAGRKDGAVLSFVFIWNGSGDGAKIRSLFDQMAISLVK